MSQGPSVGYASAALDSVMSACSYRLARDPDGRTTTYACRGLFCRLDCPRMLTRTRAKQPCSGGKVRRFVRGLLVEAEDGLQVLRHARLDQLYVGLVQFYAYTVEALDEASFQRGPGAGERVEDEAARLGDEANQPAHQGGRLARGVRGAVVQPGAFAPWRLALVAEAWEGPGSAAAVALSLDVESRAFRTLGNLLVSWRGHMGGSRRSNGDPALPVQLGYRAIRLAWAVLDTKGAMGEDEV